MSSEDENNIERHCDFRGMASCSPNINSQTFLMTNVLGIAFINTSHYKSHSAHALKI